MAASLVEDKVQTSLFMTPFRSPEVQQLTGETHWRLLLALMHCRKRCLGAAKTADAVCAQHSSWHVSPQGALVLVVTWLHSSLALACRDAGGAGQGGAADGRDQQHEQVAGLHSGRLAHGVPRGREPLQAQEDHSRGEKHMVACVQSSSPPTRHLCSPLRQSKGCGKDSQVLSKLQQHKTSRVMPCWLLSGLTRVACKSVVMDPWL